MGFLGMTLGTVVCYWIFRPAQFGRDIAKTVLSFKNAMRNLTEDDLKK